MWGRVFLLICLGLVKTVLPGESFSLPDDPYEQPVVSRYLFSPFLNDSSVWPVLDGIRNIWQVQSLPEFHSQSSNTFWFLAELSDSSLRMGSMSFNSSTSVKISTKISVSSNGSSLLFFTARQEKRFNSTLALISPSSIQFIRCDSSDASDCSLIQQIDFPSDLSVKTHRIFSSLLIEEKGEEGWLYIGSDSGLHGLDLHRMSFVPSLNQLNSSISSLALSKKYQRIFVGTETKLWIESFDSNVSRWRFEHITALIDSPISSLAYNEFTDQLWLGQSTGITLYSSVLFADGSVHWSFSRLAGVRSSPGSTLSGLPLLNITALGFVSTENSLWLGSRFGVMRFSPDRSEVDQWRLFNSGRYFPSRESLVDVTSLALLRRETDLPPGIGTRLVCRSERGLTLIDFQQWTLQRKAEHFESLLSPRHDRYGFVSDCQMSKWGNLRTCVKGPNDNDGLWTSMYLASQVFRYAVTQDQQVKDNAWKHFQALILLNQVSGIAGYPSRSLALKGEFPPRKDWHPSPWNTSLQFQGDTSSDEIVGHQFVYPLVRDYLSQSPFERSVAEELLVNITNHIVTHHWYLIGENGTHTTWGIWNPREINDDPFYQESRGLNSLQIFAFLFESFALTGDERFFEGVEDLIEFAAYDENLVNQKAIALCDTNFSDDELAYLAYFNLIYAFRTINSSSLTPEQRERANRLIVHLTDFVVTGLELSHQYKAMEKSPFYNFIYSFVFSELPRTPHFDRQTLLDDSVWYLRRWPLDLINWPQFNSEREDLQINQLRERCGETFTPSSRELLPPDERSTHKWNGGAFDLDDGDALSEEDPTSFLLSYWGWRFITD